MAHHEHGEHPSVHRYGELVVEAGLPQDDEELGIHGSKKPTSVRHETKSSLP